MLYNSLCPFAHPCFFALLLWIVILVNIEKNFRFCSVAVTCWASPKKEIVKAAGLALNAVIKECLKDIPNDVCAKVGIVSKKV